MTMHNQLAKPDITEELMKNGFASSFWPKLGILHASISEKIIWPFTGFVIGILFGHETEFFFLAAGTGMGNPWIALGNL